MPYLTPDLPRWIPRDEPAITSAAQAGLLVESHYLDLKMTIPNGSGKNRELARDIASFAIDGGAMIVGLAERHDGPPQLVPVELAGLAERVEQIARQVPDPPIPVTCTPIAASDPVGHGYLIIEIPATGNAPHMVDGVYMGRGDKTKIRLSDPEVLRLHEARACARDQAEQLVHEYVARDPIPIGVSQQAHAFVVAAPISPRPEMLLNAQPDGLWQQLLHQLLDQGAHTPGTLLAVTGDYSPNLRSVHEFSRRADGAALTYNLTTTREPAQLHDDRSPSEDALELEVTEDGAVRVMTTRLGDDAGNGRGQVVFEDVLPDLARRTIGIAAAIADLTGYLGPWMLGVAATNLAGKSAYGSGRVNISSIGTFGTDNHEYRRYTKASATELHQTPGALNERLVGRFLRSVGFDNAPSIRPMLEDGAE